MTSDKLAIRSARRNAVTAFVVITLTLLAAGYSYYRYEVERLGQEKYAFLAGIGQLKAAQIKQWRKERAGDARRLARGPYVRQATGESPGNPVRPANRAGLMERLKLEQSEGNYHDVLLLATDGRLLLTTETNPASLSPATQRAVAAALASTNAVMSDLFREPGGMIHVDVVAVVRDAEENPLAMVVLRSRASDFLYPLIQSWPVPSRTAETMLAQREGEEVVFLNELRHQTNTALTLRLPLTRTDIPAVQAVLGSQGRFEGKDYRGIKALSDVRPVPDSPWFIVAKMDSAELAAEMRYRTVSIAGIVASLILLAAAVAAFLYRRWQAREFRDLYESERRRGELERLFRATLYSIGDAVITTDTNGAVQMMNPVAEQLSGWLEAEARGKPANEIFHFINETTRLPVVHAVDIVLREGTAVALANHTLLIARDGSERPIADSAAPIRAGNGEIAGVVLVFSDQTRQRGARKALRESEERFRAYVEQAADALFVHDFSGRFIDVNERACASLGYRREELLRMRVFDVESDFDLTRAQAVWSRVSPGESLALSGHHRRKDGTIFPVEVHFGCFDLNGERCYIGLARDITERNRMEAQLRQLASFPELNPNPVLEFASDGTLNYHNPAALVLAQSINAGDLSRLLPPGTCQIVGECLATGQACLRLETQHGQRTLSWSFYPLTTLQAVHCYVGEITGRKQAEVELQRKAAALSAAQRIGRIGNWELDLETQKLSWSPEIFRIFEIDPEEFGASYASFLQAIHPADRELVAAAYARSLQSRQPYDITHRLLLPDGRIKFVQELGETQYDESGRAIRTVGTVQDISKRVETEEALRASEEKLRQIVEHSTQLFYSHTPDNVLTYVSPQSGEFFDCEPAEAMRRWTDFVTDHPVNAEGVRLTRRAFETGERQRPYHLELLSKRGRKVWVEVSESPVVVQGKTVAIVGALTDITATRQARELLRLQTSALNAAANAIVITNRDGLIEWANPAFMAITGYSPEEVVGRPPGELLKSGKHDQAFYRAMWDTILAGMVWHGEVINRRKDGTLYTEEMIVTPVRDDSGAITHFIAVKQDITKRKLLEEQFRQAHKMEAIGQLAGGVAHDFNNMLAVILGNAGLIEMDLPSEERQHALKEISRAAERATSLTRQLLTFSRRQTLQARPLDLNDIVSGMLKMLHRIIGEDIALQTRLLSDGAPMHGDPGMLEQVLLNLTVNARDAMLNGGEIAVTLTRVTFNHKTMPRPPARPGDFIRLSVRDTGKGIAPEHLPRIFEPFFTTKDVGKGTGLGLATVHGIVEQHHGWVEVESAPGAGATFHIYLPRLPEAVQSPAGSPNVKIVPGGDETILLVEDEMALRLLATRALERYGYRVIEAANGVEARRAWEQHKHTVDLLLTDIIMPEGVSGRQLAEELCAEHPQLKVIYMSGYPGDVAGRGLDLREGVNYLKKPFGLIPLAEVVRRSLDGPSQIKAEIPNPN